MSHARGFFGHALRFIDRFAPATVVHAATATMELTLPDKLETATEMLNDPQEINKWLQARRFSELQARFNELDRPPLATQIADILDAREAQNGSVAQATKVAMDEWLAQHGALNTINRVGMGRDNESRIMAPRNTYAKRIEDLGFAGIGDFAKEIWHKNNGASSNRLQTMQQIMNDYSTIEPATGGFLIPEGFDSEIRALTLEQSIVRKYATVIQMTAPTMLFPYVDWTTNVGSTFGGWTVTRVKEGVAIVPSNATFGRARLTATKQVAAARIPNEMFADVSSLDGFIRATLPQAVAFGEDIDFLVGDGAGGPLGVLTEANTALITVTKETNQQAATVDYQNILKVYARMLPSSKGKAVWLVNPTDMPQLMSLTIPVGTGGAPIALVDIRSGPLATMLTRPIIETEKVPALGSAGDISFNDFSYYLIGDRPGSALESSPHPEFLNDVTLMKLTARNDGRPWIAAPIQPLNGNTLSPFVQLGARA